MWIYTPETTFNNYSIFYMSRSLWYRRRCHIRHSFSAYHLYVLHLFLSFPDLQHKSPPFVSWIMDTESGMHDVWLNQTYLLMFEQKDIVDSVCLFQMSHNFCYIYLSSLEESQDLYCVTCSIPLRKGWSRLIYTAHIFTQILFNKRDFEQSFTLFIVVHMLFNFLYYGFIAFIITSYILSVVSQQEK